MFTASVDYHDNEVEDVLKLPITDEVETNRGWVLGKDLTVEDLLKDSENNYIQITKIDKTDNSYIVYILM